jgi:hypothetical protein
LAAGVVVTMSTSLAQAQTASSPASAAAPSATPSPAGAAASPASEAAAPTGAAVEINAPPAQDSTAVTQPAAGAQPPLATPGQEGTAAATGAPAAMVEDPAASALADQIANELASSSSSQGPKLNIYGFSDFTFAKRLTNHSTDLIAPRTSTFYVGNFNTYLSAELGRWRSLGEVRFTYLPNGSETYDFTTGSSVRTSTAASDYADWGRSKKVGGVIIERVWLEYSAHELLTVRAGQFLTPYGIWNVDHGSPVVIGITRPFIVGNDWLPARQTGLEIYGSYGIKSTQLGYHLTLSNGRGPIDEYQDLDSNKAIGWRVWAKHDSPIGTFAIGTSGYKGRYTDATTKFGATGGATYPIVSRYDELSLAADFKWSWGGYLLQSEAILHDTRYDDSVRPAAQFGPPGSGWTPDSRVWGYYALTGYRFKWNGLMPFVQNQYQNWGKEQFLTVWEFSGGLNARPNEMVVLKVAGLWLWRPDPYIFSKTEAQFAAQVAWSF